MKNIRKLVFIFTLVSHAAFASLGLDEVSPSLVDVRVSDVATQGKILKRNQMFPIETILVGIPAEITVPNACTDFVGQQQVTKGDVIELNVRGSFNPMMDACIEILPAPVDTVLTVTLQHFNELVPSVGVIKKTLKIDGHIYGLTVNLKSGNVQILSLEDYYDYPLNLDRFEGLAYAN